MEVKTIVLHHTATPGKGTGELEWNTIKRACQAKRGEEYLCDYHYGIGGTGLLLIGQSEENPCWHCGVDTINKSSLAVACVGNFEESPMPSQQESRLIMLLRDLKIQYPKSTLRLHKDIVSTLCPGKLFPTERILKSFTRKKFSDLSPEYIFIRAIDDMVEKGIMSGDGAGEGTFRPNDPVTRGELAQVVYNALNHCKII
jgi:N-acetyl-anhydromuramyl-L-alanine amidase AmpD